MAVQPIESIEAKATGNDSVTSLWMRHEQTRKSEAAENKQQAEETGTARQWSPEDRQALEKAQEELKERLESQGVNFEFRLLEQDGELQVEVRDGKSGNVLHRFPPDSLLKLRDFNSDFAGAFFHQTF